MSTFTYSNNKISTTLSLDLTTHGIQQMSTRNVSAEELEDAYEFGWEIKNTKQDRGVSLIYFKDIIMVTVTNMRKVITVYRRIDLESQGITPEEFEAWMCLMRCVWGFNSQEELNQPFYDELKDLLSHYSAIFSSDRLNFILHWKERTGNMKYMYPYNTDLYTMAAVRCNAQGSGYEVLDLLKVFGVICDEEYSSFLRRESIKAIYTSKNEYGDPARNISIPANHVARAGDVDSLRDMLTNSRWFARMGDQNGWNAVIWATYCNNLECLKLLVQCQADLSSTERQGWTVLHLAAMADSTECMRFLLCWRCYCRHKLSMPDTSTGTLPPCGVDFDAYVGMIRDRFGCDSEMLNRIMHTGARIKLNARDIHSKTPVAYAVGLNRGHECLRSLLISGADPNVSSPFRFGNFPVHDAAYVGDLSGLRQLTDCGANLDVFDSEGQTPLDLAISRNKVACVEYLRQIYHPSNVSNGASTCRSATQHYSSVIKKKEKKKKAFVEL